MSEPTIVARIPFIVGDSHTLAGCSVGIDTEGRAWFCRAGGFPVWWTDVDGIEERAVNVRWHADLKATHAEMVEQMAEALASNQIVATT